jgi:para-nitrobenzyl esterase
MIEHRRGFIRPGPCDQLRWANASPIWRDWLTTTCTNTPRLKGLKRLNRGGIMRGWRALSTLICWLVLIGSGHAQVRPTESGPVKGFTAGGVSQFRGVPYAAPPVGARRWRPPARPGTWSGTRDATQYGPACEQELTLYPVSEDCLTLNIFVPALASSKSNLPVMVWIHGGAFVNGSGRDFDASALVTQGDVIVVTINYRLGYFGFLAHPALSAASAYHASGNYGLLDQQAAFGWVRRNIAAFGGNPRRVTIFGESAGGQSVIDQLISPSAGPLAAAIAQSGSYATKLPTLAAAEVEGTQAASALGCPDQTASCLYRLSAQALNVLNPLNNLQSVSPVVDGHTIPMSPAQAFAGGHFQRIPVINGSNHDEYRLFVGLERWATHAPATTVSQYVARMKAQFGPIAPEVLAVYPASRYTQPDYAYAAALTDIAFACNTHLLNAQMAPYTKVYEYELDDPNAPTASGPVIQGFSYGSAHSSDLSYLFPRYNVAAFHPDGPPPLSDAQLRLRTTIQKTWADFARTGIPNASARGSWPIFGKYPQQVQSLVPPAPTARRDFSVDHHCGFWKPILLSEAGLSQDAAY